MQFLDFKNALTFGPSIFLHAKKNFLDFSDFFLKNFFKFFFAFICKKFTTNMRKCNKISNQWFFLKKASKGPKINNTNSEQEIKKINPRKKNRFSQK